MAKSLSAEEMSRLEEFLRPPRIAVVTTVGDDGVPQATPNWYRFSNGVPQISTRKETAKYRNLSRNPRVAVCIYSEPLAKEYATVRGRAEIRDDESIWPDTQAIIERYAAPERVEQLVRTLRTQNRVIISLSPDHVVFRA